MTEGKGRTARTTARAVLAGLYLVAGALHLTHPGPFVSIMPPWIPFSGAVVAVTGLAEIAGAIGLMVPNLRRAAGVGLAIYAVCVFPANIQHAINGLGRPDSLSGWWYHGPRLLFQPVIVWWALWASETVDRPLSRKP